MPCRMHSRNLITSRASESGKVSGRHARVPAIPGHSLAVRCLRSCPQSSTLRGFRAYSWKIEAGKEKLPKEQSGRGRRWEEAAIAPLSPQ